MRDKSFLCDVKKKTQRHGDIVQRACEDIRRVRVLRELGSRNGVDVERSRLEHYPFLTGKIVAGVSKGHNTFIFSV